MSVKSLRCVDYLEWLTGEEEFLVAEMELAGEIADNMYVEKLEEELQMVRELKEIVTKWGNQDVN